MKENIDKCLFLIGSGFSRPAGCKVSSEMLADLQKHTQHEGGNIFNPVEKEVLKFLLFYLSYHCKWRSIQSGGRFKFNPNIEDLILLIKRIKDREKYFPYPIIKTQSEIDFKNLFSSIEFKIKTKLLKNWLKFNEKRLSYLKPLKSFLQDYPNQTFCINIFSLNYDLVIEKCFSEAGLWKGFSNGKWVGLESSPNIDDERRRINLYKLYGSLDWIRDEAGDIWEGEKNSKKDLETDPFIIFGQGIKTVEPFFSLIYHFRKLLIEKEYIFVIGYSFSDPYINNLLFSVIAGTNKRLVIVNPALGIEEIKNIQGQNTESKFGECQHPDYKEKISEYLKEIQKNPFYSELLEFNIRWIKPDNLFYIVWKIEEFIKKYFSDRGNLLKELIEQFERERAYWEPFK